MIHCCCSGGQTAVWRGIPTSMVTWRCCTCRLKTSGDLTSSYTTSTL